MLEITAKEAQNRFGTLIDKALESPVTVKRHGRPVVVVVSQKEYESLCNSDSDIIVADDTVKDFHMLGEKSFDFWDHPADSIYETFYQ